MKVEIEIPDALFEVLRSRFGDVSRKALEALAVQSYKAGALSTYQVQVMLGFTTRWATDGFLKEHEAWLPITIEDIDREVKAARVLTAK